MKSKTGGGTFNFTQAMQSHQATGVFNRNSSTTPQIILSVNNNTVYKKSIYILCRYCNNRFR